MGKNSQGENISTKGLNITRMRELIEESFPKIREAKDESVVLVIGNTGAGKSTTINYLRNIPLAIREVDGVKCIDIQESTSEKDSAKIGHELKSETFYPALYKYQDFNYLDTPGFGDNREKEESVCTILNTRASIKLAKTIKSVVVVIDQASFTTERAIGFKQLVVTLSGLFKNPKEALDSIVFAVTKTLPDDDLSTIQANILKCKKIVFENYQKATAMTEKEIESLDEKARREREETIQVTQNQLVILDFLVTHSQNIVLVGLFDACGVYRLKSDELLETVKEDRKYNYSYILVDAKETKLYYKTDSDLKEIELKDSKKLVKKLKEICDDNFTFKRLPKKKIELTIGKYSNHTPEEDVSKKEIRTFIAKSESIAKDKFNYVSKDEDYRKFIEILQGIISDWIAMIEEKDQKKSANKSLEKEKTELDISIATYTKQIDDITNGRLDKQSTMDTINDNIKRNKQLIDDANKSIAQLKKEKTTEENNKITEITVQQDSELYLTDSLHIDNSRIDPPSPANNNCYMHYYTERRFQYEDLPFSKTEKSLNFVTGQEWRTTYIARNGREPSIVSGKTVDDFGGYVREVENTPNNGQDRGKYVLDYKSGCGFVGDIFIKYYVQKKFMPSYKRIIVNIENRIAQKNQEISRLEANIIDMEKENLVSEGVVKAVESNLEAAKQSIPVLQGALDKARSEAKALEEKIANNARRIEQLEESIKKNLSLCQVVGELLIVLDLADSHKEFFKCLKDYDIEFNNQSYSRRFSGDKPSAFFATKKDNYQKGTSSEGEDYQMKASKNLELN